MSVGNLTGSQNVGIGNDALKNIIGGDSNIAIGSEALTLLAMERVLLQ